MPEEGRRVNADEAADSYHRSLASRLMRVGPLKWNGMEPSEMGWPENVTHVLRLV